LLSNDVLDHNLLKSVAILPRNICILNNTIKIIDFGLANVNHNQLDKSLIKLTKLLYSQALRQCEANCKKLNLVTETLYDTAGSAKYIMDNQLIDTAAIASRTAA
jgi:prephenate dehydratase